MSNRIRTIWLICLWLVALFCCFGVEWVRRAAGLGQLPAGLRWCGEFVFDTPMFLPILIVCPVCWWLTTGVVVHRSDLLRQITSEWSKWCAPRNGTHQRASFFDWCCAIAIGVTSLLSSWSIGRSLEKLPPAYHDEYSYLLQAKTLLEGRFSYPSHPDVASVFDQMHVVNQGRFASRYYPGTGAWLAPWVAMGHPLWGQWLAGSLVSMLIFWTARELGGSGVGFLAGCLTALAPGVTLFSNLALAHHPTLLGLAFFLHGFVTWLIQRKSIRLLEAGLGLAFAMLCRPATAAGIALPWGIWFAGWLLWDTQTRMRTRWTSALLLGLPIVVGWGIMAAYNQAITGSWTKSPYQLYTDVYTPRHVFGFDNVIRGAKAQGPRELPAVTRNYDAWAENLTPNLALRNVGSRLLASFRWTLGVMPLVWILLASWRLRSTTPLDGPRELGWKLVAASIICLHAIHIPYWFDGIMHWHYVFESSVLWLLLAARGVAALVVHFQSRNQPWMVTWLAGLLVVTVGANFVSFSPFWETRLEMGTAELRYSRKKYADFRGQIAREVTQFPALVLVTPDSADRHMDYVTNDPKLTGPVLFGRFVPEETPLEEIAKAFPDRQIYFYDAKTRQLRRS